jgi:hypothetical protein
MCASLHLLVGTTWRRNSSRVTQDSTPLVRLSRASSQSAPVRFPPILSDIWNRFYRFRKPKIGVEDIFSDLHSPRALRTATTPALWNRIMSHATTRDLPPFYLALTLRRPAFTVTAALSVVRRTMYIACGHLQRAQETTTSNTAAQAPGTYFYVCTIHPSRCKRTLRTILGGGIYLC